MLLLVGICARKSAFDDFSYFFLKQNIGGIIQLKADKNTTIDGTLLAAGKNGYGSYGGGGAGGSVWIQTGEFFGAGTIDVKGGSIGGTAGQYEIIRIHHECEGGIEKSVPRIIVWHQEACRVMTSDDPKGRIFISHPHT